MPSIATIIRSVIFNILYVVWTPLVGIAGAPIALLGKGTAAQKIVPTIWAYGMLIMARIILGIRYEIRGREYIVADKPAIYAAKHQSAWETIVFWRIVKNPVYVLKKELLSIPIFGQYLGYLVHTIAIDRKAGASALKSLIKQTQENLAEGRQVIIFPEGTRKNIGDKPDYQSGIAAIYSKLGVDVIPVALNSGKLWGRNAFIKQSGTIVIEFLPPIKSGLNKKEFMQLLEQRIETACKEL